MRGDDTRMIQVDQVPRKSNKKLEIEQETWTQFIYLIYFLLGYKISHRLHVSVFW